MLVTPEQMKQLENLTDKSGVSYQEMMERAGKALANFIEKNYPERKTIAFLAGNGNNGGDCYVAAYYLDRNGKQVEIFAPMGEPKTEISRQARRRAEESGIKIYTDMQNCTAEIFVDGLFGTGFRGELPENLKKFLQPKQTKQNQIRIACDIPSGGNGKTGTISSGTFSAEHTITFGAEKAGMSQYPLRTYCGKIHVAEIGIPEKAFQEISGIERLTPEKVNSSLPERKPNAYKNQFGHVLVVAGSRRMRGACILAVTAALRSGAGMMTCASTEEVLHSLMCTVPESMCLSLKTDEEGFFLNEENHDLLKKALQGKQALILGCGIGVNDSTKNLVNYLLSESRCPIILDADGLNCVADCIDCIPEGRTILTPHAGEAARLLNVETSDIQKDRFSAAKELAERTQAIIVLKGAGTIITDGKKISVCNAGNSGMARAGSGDVLAGIMGALVGQGMPLYEAACAAVMFHAQAGDKAAEKFPERYMLPQDLIRSLKEVE